MKSILCLRFSKTEEIIYLDDKKLCFVQGKYLQQDNSKTLLYLVINIILTVIK